MDIVHDTYEQLSSWNNDVIATSFSLTQHSSTLNDSIHAPSANTNMDKVLLELEAKDEKINALNNKLDQLVLTFNSFITKTDSQ